MAIASDCLITLFILQTVASFCSSAACVSSIVCARDSSIRFTCTCTTQTQRRVVQGEFSLRDLVGLAVHLHGRGRTISRAPPSFLSSLRHTHPTLLYCLSVARYSRPASLLPVCPRLLLPRAFARFFPSRTSRTGTPLGAKIFPSTADTHMRLPTKLAYLAEQAGRPRQ